MRELVVAYAAWAVLVAVIYTAIWDIVIQVRITTAAKAGKIVSAMRAEFEMMAAVLAIALLPFIIIP